MNTPKVSIIMPSLNVGPFIRECIESAVNQTLTDIEILCVDAGSTDGTAEILQEYAARDSRVHFIHSDVRSYGYQMNLGLDAATGEYIGILETDDWTEPDQFEKMYTAAREQDADLVKSNYYWYYTKGGVRSEPFENLKKCRYETVFCPMEDRNLFNVTPSIWSGIYRRQMLLDHNIRFNETPGASFQDTSFTVDATYHEELTVDYAAVDSLQYREGNVPGTRVGGFGSARLLLGFFENEEFGTYTRYTYTNPDSCIVIHVGEKILVISGSDAAETEAIFDTLRQKTGK